MLGTTQKKNRTRTQVELAALVAGCALALGLSALSLTAGAALAANEPWEEGLTMNTPFGMNPGEENRAFNPSNRDVNGNRVLVNQYSQYSNTAGVAGEGSGVGYVNGSAAAIGNQLNVVTNGNNNTVIVNSTQINNGDQEAVILNGTLDLD
ncbi:holdfast anchoring protein HfaA [Pyruvatibacter mobilis]|uniref:holdfast anchoring protein HfaA n=1 Tax=Pyruvatibacter mobilis TaxID=1712261 RepID=UPI003BAC619B